MLEDIFTYQNLQRTNVSLKESLFSEKYRHKTVLITGGAGSIAYNIILNLLESDVKRIIVLDISEYLIFKCKTQLSSKPNAEKLVLRIGDVKDKDTVKDVLYEFNPTVVIHAAALKHVDLGEENLLQFYENNFFGTKVLFDACSSSKVDDFIFLSTDKAVEPRNFMGLTKKMAEIYLQRNISNTLNVRIVRFGNVIMSRGSLIPLVQQQIKDNINIVIRGVETSRYFIYSEVVAKTILNILTLDDKNESYLIKMNKPILIDEIVNGLLRSKKFLVKS